MIRKSTLSLKRNVRNLSLAAVALFSASTAFADKQNGSNQTIINLNPSQPQACWGWNPPSWWCDPLSLLGVKHNVTCNGAENGSIDITPSGGTAPYTYLWSDGETSQDITDLDPGTYSVIVKDATGATYTASYTITQPVVFNPSINISNSNNSYCSYYSCANVDPATIYVGYGTSCVTLSANVSSSGGPYTYTWTSTNGTVARPHASSITVCPTAPTTYTLTITNGNGCVAIKSQFINVVNVQGPNGTVAICHHPSTSSSCGGSSSTPTTTTPSTIYVQPCLVAYHLCHGDDLGACPTNNDPVPRGVAGSNNANVELPAEISVYPNPSNGTFSIDVPDMADAAQIRITDINGRTAEVRSVDAHQPQKMQFNFNDKAKGIYLLEVKSGENIFRNKVIIQ